MTKKSKIPLGDHPIVVGILIISALAALFAACVAIYIFATGQENIPEVLGLATHEPSITTIHVIDVDGHPIPRADILLFYGGKYVNKSTGNDGVASFVINYSESDGIIVVEHIEYKVHEQSVDLNSNEVVRIKLFRVDGSNHTVVVRVFDTDAVKSVSGAEVNIIVGSEVYKEVTDDSGLAKFNLDFSTDTINVDLTVKFNNSEFRNQVTLLQNSVQDILISTGTNSISVEPIQNRDAQVEEAREPGAIPITFGETVNGKINSSAEFYLYSFSANAGDTIVINVEPDGVLCAAVELNDPDNVLLVESAGRTTGSDFTNAELRTKITKSGDYTIIVKACRQGGGEYHLYVNLLP